jgi:murein tripeptide amidase MpaA
MHTSTLLSTALLALVAGSAASAQVQHQRPLRYDGHAAVRVSVQTVREYQTVMALADDVLSCEGSGVGAFEVRMSPEHLAAFAQTGIAHQVLIPDIQAHIDQIWADDAAARLGDDPSWFVTYRSLSEITTRLDALAAQFPALATVSTIGNSIENRPIRMIHITGPGSTTNRPAVVVNATQHAREWVTPMSAMYVVDRLLETYATDTRIQTMVNGIDFYIIPVANPDGYEYTRNVDSQWRKNRRDLPNSSCFGVDLNRNWGYQWGYDNIGSSGSSCSDTYRGSAAFSEPESTAIKGVVDSLAAQGRLRVHWDVHANGQAILSPWGYTESPAPAQLPLMNTLGAMIRAGMATVRGTQYPYGQGSVILYLANGVTRDYSYGVHGAMAWSIEMDGATFQPALSEILPIARECLAGLLPLAEYYLPPSPPACYANCDASTSAPVLNVGDFTCFLQRYAAGESYANCDESTVTPLLNVGDFTCFLQRYAAGCP